MEGVATLVSREAYLFASRDWPDKRTWEPELNLDGARTALQEFQKKRALAADPTAAAPSPTNGSPARPSVGPVAPARVSPHSESPTVVAALVTPPRPAPPVRPATAASSPSSAPAAVSAPAKPKAKAHKRPRVEEDLDRQRALGREVLTEDENPHSKRKNAGSASGSGSKSHARAAEGRPAPPPAPPLVASAVKGALRLSVDEKVRACNPLCFLTDSKQIGLMRDKFLARLQALLAEAGAKSEPQHVIASLNDAVLRFVPSLITDCWSSPDCVPAAAERHPRHGVAKYHGSEASILLLLHQPGNHFST
jgi:hypothetical protein